MIIKKDSLVFIIASFYKKSIYKYSIILFTGTGILVEKPEVRIRNLEVSNLVVMYFFLLMCYCEYA